MIDYETEDDANNIDLDQIQDEPIINERSPRGLGINEDSEQPVELQGLDNLPLERSKYYAILNDYENGKSRLLFLGRAIFASRVPKRRLFERKGETYHSALRLM